ncbi:MAG TPA: HEAT repeat domain-containing protein, partial [Planctomycetota bacterium]|nr:HEAT repeat domain-containing protein [Planctomycetota bacterium]
MKIIRGCLMSALGLLAACQAPETRPQETLVEEIARLEDRRTLGPRGELLALLKNESAAVRARAAIAVGRLQEVHGREVTTAKLLPLIEDRDENVRAAAAFALGMRGDASVSSTLILRGTGVRADSSPLVRARLIEAASKLEEPSMLTQYFTALGDASAAVRLEAAAGAARWKTDTKAAKVVDARLAAFVAEERDPLARTYGLFALERRKATAGREVCLKSARAAEPEERLFAVRGLAALADDALALE